MKIKGIEGLTVNDLNREVERGAKFVQYYYTISIVVMTFKRPTSIYFVRGGESAVGKGIWFSIITFVFGWWGIPWGPIYSIGSLFTNFTGGKDLTTAIMASFTEAAEEPVMPIEGTR